MSNLVIYTDANASNIENLCRKIVEMDIIVKSVEDIKNIEIENADIAVIDISLDKLK